MRIYYYINFKPEYGNDDYIFTIEIKDEYDVEMVSKIIIPGDFIRIASKNVAIDSTNVNYIEIPKKMIEVGGIIYGSRDNPFKIEAGMNIDIQIPQTNANRIRKMMKLMESISTDKFEIYKQSISSEHIQNESFRILQRYIEREPYKVIFGNDVISSMNKELVKVVFVSWKFIKEQDDKMTHILTNLNHKYNKANIVVFWKGNENYSELKNYGGIVGVLY